MHMSLYFIQHLYDDSISTTRPGRRPTTRAPAIKALSRAETCSTMLHKSRVLGSRARLSQSHPPAAACEMHTRACLIGTVARATSASGRSQSLQITAHCSRACRRPFWKAPSSSLLPMVRSAAVAARSEVAGEHSSPQAARPKWPQTSWSHWLWLQQMASSATAA